MYVRRLQPEKGHHVLVVSTVAKCKNDNASLVQT